MIWCHIKSFKGSISANKCVQGLCVECIWMYSRCSSTAWNVVICVQTVTVSHFYLRLLPHTAAWLLKWDNQPFSLSPILPPYLPSIYHIPPFDQCQGTCGRSQWVCECVTEIMNVLSYVLCVSAVSVCVCVCAYKIGHALISHAVLSLNWRAVYDRGWC